MVLNRVTGLAGIRVRSSHQVLGLELRRVGQQVLAQLGLGGVQRNRQSGLDPAQRQALKDPGIPHRREDQVLVPDIALRAQQINRLQHIVQIVRRLAHAHENHFVNGPQSARQRHLGKDFTTAQLTQEPPLTRHAKLATHGTTDLAGNTEPAARQQHALHALPVLQAHQQAHRTVFAGVAALQHRQVFQGLRQPRQGRTQCSGHERFQRASPTVLRFGLCP